MKKLVVLNLKNSFLLDDIKDYVLKIKDLMPSHLKVVVCPSMVYLPFFRGNSSFLLGAQNGVDTSIVGDVTLDELKSLGVSYVLLGHSSRLKAYPSITSFIASSVVSCVKLGMIPIICVGETLEEYSLGKSGEVVLKQLRKYLSLVSDISRVVIAYEPIFAIGGEKICNLKHINDMVGLIKRNLFKKYNTNVSVIYGGSIGTSSIKSLEGLDCLDGYLIGNKSVNIEETQKIMDIIS